MATVNMGGNRLDVPSYRLSCEWIVIVACQRLLKGCRGLGDQVDGGDFSLPRFLVVRYHVIVATGRSLECSGGKPSEYVKMTLVVRTRCCGIVSCKTIYCKPYRERKKMPWTGLDSARLSL